MASLLEGTGGRAGQGGGRGGQAEGAAADPGAGHRSRAGTHAGQLPGPRQRNAAAPGQGEPYAVLCSIFLWLLGGFWWQMRGLLEKTEMFEGTRASGRGETLPCSWTMVLEGEEARGSILVGCRIPGGCQHQ